ncbi:mucin-binding protein [Lacticaseibacillus suihuaensis]
MQRNEQRAKLARATYQEKRHYKMFKSGKAWAVMGISLFFAGSLSFVRPASPVHAAETTAVQTATPQVTIQNLTGTSATGNVFDVTLAAGLVAPDWTAEDFQTTAVAGQDGQYTATLSTQGLAALQAANPAQKLAASDVKAGTLTVAQPSDTQSGADNGVKATATGAVTGQTVADRTVATAAQGVTAASTTAVKTAGTSEATGSTEATPSVAPVDSRDATETTDAAGIATTGAASGVSATSTDATADIAESGNAADGSAEDAASTEQETSQEATATKRSAQSVASEPAQTAAAPTGTTPSNASTAKLTPSATEVGYQSGQTEFHFTVDMSVKQGDVVTVTLPADTGVFLYNRIADFQSPDIGSTNAVKNADGSRTVTTTFKQGGTFQQIIYYDLRGNYTGQEKPADFVGVRHYTATVDVNGVQTGEASWTATATPTADVKSPTRIHPGTNIDKILPNVDYVWELAINEDDGVFDDSNDSKRVNSAVNHGTVITVPTPAGFVLNADLTAAVNAFDDGTTITQAGGAGSDVIITVPKGAGGQNFQGQAPYRIAGQFDLTQTTDDQTLTAAGPVVMVQQVDSAGTKWTFTGATWTDTLLGTAAGDQSAVAEYDGKGNSSSNEAKLVLDADPTNDPASLFRLAATYDGAAPTTDATITITVPDGMNVNKIQTPAGTATYNWYMPGTKSYGYVLTLADGSTETGTVAAGETITSTGTIRTAVLTPDYLVPGAQTDFFTAYGHLSATYDNGDAVQVGAQLIPTITLDAPGIDDASNKPGQFTETVVEPTGWIHVIGYGSRPSDPGTNTPGQGQGSKMYVSLAGNSGQTTDLIYEPIFYFVVPSAFVVDEVDYAQDAKITTTEIEGGSTVVKVDFTGTGESVNTATMTEYNLQVVMHNAPDAMAGDYHLRAYVTTPNTPIMQDTKVTNLAETLGDADAIEVDADGLDWKIETIEGTYESSVAQGDDLSPTDAATIDKNSTNPMTFYTAVLNTAGQGITDAAVAVNLPEVGDDQGSTYTFQLTGSVQLPDALTLQDGSTVPLTGAKVLYSTSRSTLSGTTPDLTGYVEADGVTNWAAIRSLIIVLGDLPQASTTGRIAIVGTVADMKNQALTIGYISTALYTAGNTVSVYDKAASLAITGESTIYARAHYVDAEGKDQYVALTNLDKTFKDKVDTLDNDDFPATLSAADLALLPEGYVLRANSLHLVDGEDDGVAAFGQTVVDNFDGDFAQYELDQEASLAVTYVDDTTGDTVSTVPEAASGIVGQSGTYTTVVPSGYVLAKGQASTVAYTLTADDSDNLTIHLIHATTTDTLQTTRTIDFTVANDPTLAPATVTQTATWNVVTDNQTGVTTYTLGTPYAAYTAPEVKGYKIDGNKTLAGGVAGESTTTKPENTQAVFNYVPDTVTVLIKYVDDDENGAQIGDTETVTGLNGETTQVVAKWHDGYYFAPGTYDVNNVKLTPTPGVVLFHLKHVITHGTATTTRTITYKGAGTKTPAPVAQVVTWNTSTDLVTKETVATAQDGYAAVETPTIAGYTVDKASVDAATLAPTTIDALKNTDVTVTYSAGTQAINVKYVDDAKNGAQVGEIETLSGNTDTTADWTATVPTNYVLADGQAASGTVTFEPGTGDVIIHLTHGITHGTATTTRTITYKGAGTKTPAPVAQIVTWNTSTDNVTSQTVATAQDGYAAVVTPTIAGYTPDAKSVDAATLAPTTVDALKDTAVTVTYSAGTQAINVKYVDDAKNGAQVGEITTLSGNTDTTAGWTATVPEGYVLADGQAASGTVTFAAQNADVIIHLTHAITHGTTTTTRTITYTGAGTKTPASVAQVVTWNTSTDNVTGETVATAQDGYAAVETPTIAGYTADLASVDAATLAPTTIDALKDTDVTVTYTADPQQATVRFIDDVTGKQVGTDATLSGATDATVTWTADGTEMTAAHTGWLDWQMLGYKLADGQAASGDYTFAVTGNAPLEIHLTHAQTVVPAAVTTTYTVVYQADNGKDLGLAPKTQTVAWQATTDNVTHVTTYTPDKTALDLVTSPSVTGYTADAATAFGMALTSTTTKPIDVTTTVTYSGTTQFAQFLYIDDSATTNGHLVIVNRDQRSGATATTGTYHVTVPAGYLLAAGQGDTVAYEIPASDFSIYQIHLVHQVTHGTATTKRTITYVGGGAATPKPVVQNVTWNTSTDNVTGQTVATAQDGYTAVVTPTIAGYTPDAKSVDAAALAPTTVDALKDTAVTVTYKADTQTVNVKYVDDANNGAQVGDIDTLSGATDTKADWTAEVPTGYVLADGQAASGSVTFEPDADDVIIHLTHGITHGTATTTRTITYTGAGTKTPAPVAQVVTWNTSTDNVTGQTVATAQDGYAAVVTPIIAGYTPDAKGVDAATLAPTTVDALKDTAVAVTYKADTQTINVKYVDDANGESQVGDTEMLSGKTDTTGNWTATVPEGYVLADGQAASGTVTFEPDADDVIIHLTHGITHGTATTTRTITYKGAGTKTPASVAQVVTWNTSTDNVTGQTVATAQDGYAAAVTPTIAGYTPDLANVDGATLAPTTVDALKDTTVTMTYKADTQTINVKYVDDANGESQVGDTDTLSGPTDTKADWTAEVPTGYVLADGQAASGTVTFAATNDDVIIHLTHGITHGTATTTRTITYTGAGTKTPAPVAQVVTWNTSTDNVTGQTVATAQDGYAAVVTPTIAGYTPDAKSVDAATLAPTTVDALKDTAVTVTYKADTQTINVKYVDDANNEAQVGDTDTLSGPTDTKADWTAEVPTGYVLADGQAASGTVTFAATNDDVIIHLTHGITHGTATTTRTITYTGAGTKTPAPVAQVVTWNTSTDNVTGQTVATAQDGYAAVVTPTIAGYTPDAKSVDAATLAPTTVDALKDTAVTVTYKADTQTVNVKYVDDANGEFQVGDTETLSGPTDTEADWTAEVPTGYVLADGQAASGSVTFEPGADDVIIHLTHAVTHGTATTTRTITYVVNGAATAPAPVTQTVDWLTTTDAVTGQTVATAQGAYAGVTSPTIAGYTPDQTTVAQLAPAPTATPSDTAVTVTYTGDQQKAQIIFSTPSIVTLAVVNATGASDSAVPDAEWSTLLAAFIASGYQVQKNEAAGATFDHDDAVEQRFDIVLIRPDTNPGGGDTTNPGGGDTTNPGGGDTTNPGGGDTTNPGGGDTTNPGGGDTTNPGGGDTTNPGGGDTTNPGGGDTTNPGGGDTTNPGGGDTTNPGGGDTTNPGGGDTTNPGGGDTTNPGGGDTTNPGGGDTTNPGGGDTTNPGGGDTTNPGGGDTTNPGGGDTTNPGGGDTTNPGGGDTTNPGGGDTTNPGGGDTTNPGGGDTTNPGGGDTTNPGGGDTTNPGGGDTTNPGGGDTTNPGGGDTTNPGGGDTTNPGGGDTTNPGGDTTNPGGGDTTNPGGGDTTNPGGGDTTNPGGGDTTNPGGGDTTNPGGGDTTNPGGGDTTNPGGGDTTNPGGGDTTNPGGGDTTNPGGGDTTNPGGGDTTNPGGGDTTNPGGGDTTNPGGGDTTNPGGGDTTNPGGGDTTNPGGDDTTTTPGKGTATTPTTDVTAPHLPITGGSDDTTPTAALTTATTGKNLPQTGEQRNTGLVALGLAMMSGLLALAGKRRRKQD